MGRIVLTKTVVFLGVIAILFVQMVKPIFVVNAVEQDVTRPVITGVLNPTVNLSETNSFEIPSVSIVDDSGALLSPQITFYKADGVTYIPNLDALKNELSLGHQVIIRYDATDNSGNSATPFIMVVNVKDDIKPIITGVESGATYEEGTELTLGFNEGYARLNGKLVSNGTKVSASGSYTLIVTDTQGNKTTTYFSIVQSGFEFESINLSLGEFDFIFDWWLSLLFISAIVAVYLIWKPSKKKS